MISNFQLQNEISPIILHNGIAQGMPDDTMLITSLTELNGQNNFTYDDYFAHYKNLPGGTLAEWHIAEYPFASLVMAANAVIQMPLKISMLMICPVQNDFNRNYAAKVSVLSNVKNQIQNHVLLGGTFTVVTPAFTYSDVLLRQIRDVTPPSEKQVQILYQWEFEQPLITQAGVNQVLGNFAYKVQSGLPTPTAWNTR